MWQFVVKKSLKVVLLNHWYGKKTLRLCHCILSSLCCRIALSLMVNLCHFQKIFIPTQSLLYTLCNKKEMMCLYFFVDSCCDSHNNELHYVVGFNKGVGSLKMWLHLYFALVCWLETHVCYWWFRSISNYSLVSYSIRNRKRRTRVPLGFPLCKLHALINI